MDTTDYGYDLSELPIASGSDPGANVITIAFASMNYNEYSQFELGYLLIIQ